MIRFEDVTERNFREIIVPCRYCIYWQTSGEFGEEMLKPELEKTKHEWFSKVFEEFGSCIKLASTNGTTVGFLQYGPAKFLPQVEDYACGPPSKDAIFIACLYVADKNSRGKGVGKTMLNSLMIELRKRGVKTVETFARRSSENNPSGPLELYLKHGFRVIRGENEDFPLVRREL